MSQPYQYIAYVDEAGDPGLANIKPIDSKGSSEWLILSGVLVRASNELRTKDWDRDFRIAGGRKPEHAIHFRKLRDPHQLAVCEELAKLPVRAFVVASNKKNIRRYKNDFAQAQRDTLMDHSQSYSWLYFWLFRLLMEKMTDYAARRAVFDNAPSGLMKIEISRCSHVHYPDLIKYLHWLRIKDRQGTQFITQGAITWSAIDFDLIEDHDHATRSGLVLPDIVASAFFAACDRVDRGRSPNPFPAFKLDKRMARRSERRDDTPAFYGVKLFPSFRDAALDEEQARIFRHSGYR